MTATISVTLTIGPTTADTDAVYDDVRQYLRADTTRVDDVEDSSIDDVSIDNLTEE